jgi:hypothetical protein
MPNYRRMRSNSNPTRYTGESTCQLAASQLCQNPIQFSLWELLFERKQRPQIIDTTHFHMEQTEPLGLLIVLRNQQVEGSSTPAFFGGSLCTVPKGHVTECAYQV